MFSKKKEPSRVTAHDEAVLQLKSQRDKMKQYMRRSEAQMEREREMAKKLIQSGKKDRALFLLKKKRFQDQMIEKALKQLDNIERMVSLSPYFHN
uniref:Charged multivesicular body protein 6 n=1 Tax=Plectus sambesii TaxID=2011161 RepID=A0A914WTU1_9BILA